jgi:sugar lactone lactonase YvrE
MVSTISSGIDMPEYLAFDASGNLYMTYNKIVHVSSTGSLSLIDNANYDGLAADNSGNIYAATLQRIMKLNPSTGKMDVFVGTGKVGSDDGGLSTATFTYIEGITFDKNGNIYVLDGNSIRIVDIAKSQVKTLTLKGSQSPFNNPQGLAVDQWDNVYVANYGDSNSGNGYILKITPDGSVSNFAGNRQKSGNPGGLQGAAQSVSFDGATGIILLPSGNFLVSCMSGNVIQKITTHKQQ